MAWSDRLSGGLAQTGISFGSCAIDCTYLSNDVADNEALSAFGGGFKKNQGRKLVKPGVTQKEAAGNTSGPSLGGVPKEEKDTGASLLGCA